MFPRESLNLLITFAGLLLFKKIATPLDDDEKELKKQEMKEQWKEFLPLSPEEKKQKLEAYVKSLKN